MLRFPYSLSQSYSNCRNVELYLSFSRHQKNSIRTRCLELRKESPKMIGTDGYKIGFK